MIPDYISDPWDRSHDQSFLEVYDTITGKRKVLQFFDALIEAPNWTPDGRYLIFNMDGNLWKYELPTGMVTRINTGNINHCNNDHVVSADGSFIGFSSGCEDGRSRVFAVPFAGGEPRLVTESGPSYLHGIAPDGSVIVYCAERGGKYDVYSCNSDGSREMRLTSAPGLNDGCEYDMSGKHIWFNSVRTGLMQAFVMDADGKNQAQMTFDCDRNTWFPHISPDMSKVVMLSYRKGDVEPDQHIPHRNVELRLMNSDGTNLQTVVELFGGQGSINVNSWSPDSRSFAFVSYRFRKEDN